MTIRVRAVTDDADGLTISSSFMVGTRLRSPGSGKSREDG
jgi:hypothetical protein